MLVFYFSNNEEIKSSNFTLLLLACILKGACYFVRALELDCHRQTAAAQRAPRRRRLRVPMAMPPTSPVLGTGSVECNGSGHVTGLDGAPEGTGVQAVIARQEVEHVAALFTGVAVPAGAGGRTWGIDPE